MYTEKTTSSFWSALGAVAVAFTLSAGSAAGKDVTVAIPVTSQGLDLSQPADAQKFYSRLQHAATVACTHGNRVDLAPVADPQECFEKALAAAISSTKSPVLTQIYLAAHTVREAAARGIAVPPQLAAQ